MPKTAFVAVGCLLWLHLYLAETKITSLEESEVSARRREVRQAMSEWSQSLEEAEAENKTDFFFNQTTNITEFKELSAEASPLGIVEAGRFLSNPDVLNR